MCQQALNQDFRTVHNSVALRRFDYQAREHPPRIDSMGRAAWPVRIAKMDAYSGQEPAIAPASQP
jgi:hypothetical protein